MKKDDNSSGDGEEQFEFEPDDSWSSGSKLFTDLDENEEFEESDRDSEYASMYTEVEEEEPDFPGEEDSEDQLDIIDAAAEPTTWEDQDSQSNESWVDDDWEQDPAPSEPEPLGEPEQDTWTALSALRADEQDFEVQPDDADDTWEEESYEAEEEREVTLPLGLIAVGVIALALLGAGGYGVMQDRAALQEEIRQLQSSMATAASPADVAEARSTSETVALRNRELEQQLARLSSENRSLQSIIGGLEAQLQAQQEALAKPKAPPPAPKPAPAPAAAPKKVVSKPAAKTPASAPSASVTAGSWFVNFGSYSQRPTAESWVGRLKPASGDVVVSTGEKDGRTFYRVRVINLASKEEANSTARKLEETYKLSRLWVGQSR